MAGTKISAAEAVKAFKTRPMVQTARVGKVQVDAGDGKKTERDGYVTKDEQLSEKHILSAVKFDDRLVVVTIDGRKHEAALA
jgi:ribosomal protein S4E